MNEEIFFLFNLQVKLRKNLHTHGQLYTHIIDGNVAFTELKQVVNFGGETPFLFFFYLMPKQGMKRTRSLSTPDGMSNETMGK